MIDNRLWAAIIVLLVILISGCKESEDKTESFKIDYLIINGEVYDGVSQTSQSINVGICEKVICFLGQETPKAEKIIDASELVITPGFIDPHTHSLEELASTDKRSNINYLTQGVTTVINGNDGGGKANIEQLRKSLTTNGIGTNLGLLVGHGAIRIQVMGTVKRAPTESELKGMKKLVAKAMEAGALGLSTGLYYVPGVYSETDEVIELAKVAAKYDGIYDTHLRDESTFNIGFLKAVQEAIDIAKSANIHLHIAHIKALGVDVWGQSEQAISMIEEAHDNGVSISADQYPWQASGTYLNSAVMPSWVRADSKSKFHKRLQDKELLPRIKIEIKENIRRRGGSKALLITESKNIDWLGKTLEQIAAVHQLTAEEMAIHIALEEAVRVASFNMSYYDIQNFMKKHWVVSSSDGTDGHPRKYASFPRKYEEYVVKRKLISFSQFVKQSSSETAKIFKIANRGEIKIGHYADINLINLKNYKAIADFSRWNRLSAGINYQFVNGKPTIEGGEYTGALNGLVLKRGE